MFSRFGSPDGFRLYTRMLFGRVRSFLALPDVLEELFLALPDVLEELLAAGVACECCAPRSR